MGLDKNLELVGKESVKLNECFKEFTDLHEEIQELLTEEEQIPDTQRYDNLHTEVERIRETVQKWMIDAGQRSNEERKSTKSSAKTKNSKASHASSTSSRTRTLQAKARQAELEARIAQLDDVEAVRKEAERARLRVDFAAAAAISKVYEDAIKEDEEQYLGSDDPGDDPECYRWPALHGLHPQETFVKEGHSSPRAHDEELMKHPHAPDPAAGQRKDTLNTKAPEFTLPTTPLQQDIVNTSGNTVNQVAAEGDSHTIAKANYEPRADFWEKMELRMMQPPPAPTPFDGDPSRYLRFRANFRDQVENRASLTGSEKIQSEVLCC